MGQGDQVLRCQGGVTFARSRRSKAAAGRQSTLRFLIQGEGPGLLRRTNPNFGRASAPQRARIVSINLTRYSGQNEIGSRASDPADG
jgi:hypothetical protein